MKKNSSASSGCWPGWRPSWRTSKKKLASPFFYTSTIGHLTGKDTVASLQRYRQIAFLLENEIMAIFHDTRRCNHRWKASSFFSPCSRAKKKKRTRRKGSKRFGKKLSFFTIQHTLTLDELFPGVLILDGVWKRDVKGLMEYLCCI